MSEWRRVVLPHLARPNLVARLYMLMTAQATVSLAWLLPTSASARIADAGGWIAQALLLVMAFAIACGAADVLVNDVARIDDRPRGPDWLVSVAALLKSRRMDRCWAIGGCYLVQAYAGLDSDVQGNAWLLSHYLSMAALAGLLSWALWFLNDAECAERDGGDDSASA